MSHQHPRPDGWENEPRPAIEAAAGILRTGPRVAGTVQPIELFFDLVYVLAVTQLTHYLLEHLTWRGAGETLLLFLLVFRGWATIAWVSNYFDLQARSVRLVLIGLAFVSLIVSASIPQAFGDHGLAFALASGGVLIGAQVFAWASVGRRHPLGMVFERVLIWHSITGLVLLAGALVEGDARVVLWLGAITGSLYVTWLGFPLPWLGHSHTTDYPIMGEHIAERCLLFVTLALGESIIITGTNFGELPNTNEAWLAFAAAFVGTAAVWWTYFDRGAEAGREMISAADDPGRLGLIAYTFCHIPIVAGIVVAAAGDEIAIAHPGDEVSMAEAALILGGPALYLVGHSLFKLAVWGHLSPSRASGVLALVALVPLAAMSSALVLTIAATAVLVGVVLWDLVIEHKRLEAEARAVAAAAEA
jgi:low temperature requirement protein LtrA